MSTARHNVWGVSSLMLGVMVLSGCATQQATTPAQPEVAVGDPVQVYAAGSLRADIRPGDLMLLSDHINFSGLNPLIGEATDARFVPMGDAHDPALRAALRTSAEAVGVALPEGVYAWYSGPSFETPAEIRAIRILGGDAVGMSTVPEVILARFLGLRVTAISTITNMAAGLSDEKISHEHTKAMAPLGAAKLERVLRHFLRQLR